MSKREWSWTCPDCGLTLACEHADCVTGYERGCQCCTARLRGSHEPCEPRVAPRWCPYCPSQSDVWAIRLDPTTGERAARRDGDEATPRFSVALWFCGACSGTWPRTE